MESGGKLFLRLVGNIFIGMAAFFALFAVIGLIVPGLGRLPFRSFLLSIIFMVGPFFLFGYWMKKYSKKDSTEKNKFAPITSSMDYKVLELARENKGFLTASDVSIYFKTDIETSKKILEEMVNKNIAEPEVDEKGVIYYRFNELID